MCVATCILAALLEGCDTETRLLRGGEGEEGFPTTAQTGRMTMWSDSPSAVVGGSCEYANANNGGLSSPAAASPHIGSLAYCKVDSTLYENGAKCGSCYRVSYDGSQAIDSGRAGSLVVQIVDSGGANTFDCQVEAFEVITGARTGIFPITYEPVDCNVAAYGATATVLDGGNAHYTKVIFSNLAQAVVGAELIVGTQGFSMQRVSGATWSAQTHGASGNATFKVTSAGGQQTSMDACFASWPVATGASCSGNLSAGLIPVPTLAPTSTTIPESMSSTPLVPVSTPDPTTPASTSTTPLASSEGWHRGTWTTGYWDCCKPSCSWSNKGNVTQPVAACDAATGNVLTDSNVVSVCEGGTATTCSNNQPFIVNSGLSMGFAAAAVGGISGLNGDENCGQCYALHFIDQTHDPNGDNWGGAHPELVGKTMVVQVTNIGYDVSGEHSFDIQIPGAGQGIFTSGCVAQFPGTQVGDHDCDNNYGGCSDKSGCARLPEELQAGCEWRHDWYHWLKVSGQTNNPHVDFRRVQCPSQLTNISGSVVLDDANFPAINPSDYA